MRTRLLPIVVSTAFSAEPLREYMFRTVSQTVVNYRGSSLSQGRAGTVQGGDRLPWVKTDGSGSDADNFAPLRSLDWQVHVYGEASSGIRAACEARKISLHVFPWRPETAQAGLRRNAVYLVRPDGYVALADAEGSAAAIESYLDARNLTLMRTPAHASVSVRGGK